MDLGTLASIASAAASIGSKFLGKSKKGGTLNLEEMLPSWMKESAQGLSKWAKQYMNLFIPGTAYGDQFTAGMSPYETQGLGLLSKLLNLPATGELFGAGKQQLLDTLGGRYADIKSSPWIRSMINLSKQNLGDLITQARGRRGARGTYYTSDALSEESDLGERTQNYLDTIIGQFIESERGRQFGAVEPALAYEQYGGMTAPLSRISASQTFGALPRLIEQARLEAKYKDFLRIRQEQTMPLGVAQSLATTNPFPAMLQQPNTEQSNPLGNILGMITDLVEKYKGGGGIIP